MVAFGFALGLYLCCAGVLIWWVASVGCVIGIALLGPKTPNLGVGLSVVTFMVFVLFVVELVVVV